MVFLRNTLIFKDTVSLIVEVSEVKRDVMSPVNVNVIILLGLTKVLIQSLRRIQ